MDYYLATIEGIDPPPDRPYQGSGRHIETIRQWGHANLERLPEDKRHANAEVVIFRVDKVEIERFGRVKKESEKDLKDEVIDIIEAIGQSTVKLGTVAVSVVDVRDRLVGALKKAK